MKEAEYIKVVEQFKDNYPQTVCHITKKERTAFEDYVKSIQTYVNTGNR